MSLALPIDKLRCLAHSKEHRGGPPRWWCERREECARHVAIRFDPFNGSLKVGDEALCKAGGKDHFIPLNQLEYS